MLNSTLKQLSTLLAQKKLSSVELTQSYLDRVAQFNPGLNAFLTVDADRSLEQARAADAAQPLPGIPLAHKDIFCAQGWRTSCGSKMLANFISPYDAHVVEQLNA